MADTDAVLGLSSSQLPIFLSFLSILTVFVILKVWNRNKGQPPTYKGWIPWLGCAIEFGQSPLDFIEKKRKELGPVFTLGVAGERLTFVTEPEDFHYFFQSSDVDFQKGVQDAVQNVSSISPENFFKYHTTLHDTVKGRLAAARLGSLSGNLCQEFNERLNLLEHQGDGDLNLIVRHSMYAAIINNLFGKDVLPVKDKEVYRKLVDSFVCYDDQFEYGARLPPFLLRDWSSAKSYLLGLFQDIVKKIDYQQTTSEEGKTLLETFVGNIDKSCAPNYSLMLLWASLANAVPITFWTLAFILENEEVKQKLLGELHKLQLQTSEAVVAVSEDDMKKVPYLKWCILEAVRLRATGIVTRRVVKTFTIREQTIPAGDMLMVSPYWSHRNEKYFPESDSYKPERWAEAELEKGNFLEGFIAFGGGRYMCPGRWFALMEIQMFVAIILMKFELSLTGAVPPRSPKHLVGTQQPTGTCSVHYQKLGL